ncbi:MAG TPA: hypothetical protein VFF06_21365 [Polyangia bacterium]|nr:hypothetical protein [Polyangia bacterium]
MRRLLFVAALLACGCKARTEIVLGVITDLLAPDLLDTVKLTVTNSDNGKTLIERDWSIPGTPNTEFILPGSFGLYSEDGSEPRVAIEVAGFKGGVDTPARVTHHSVLNLISEQTLFLRESLVAGCRDNTDCKLDQNQTCLEGRCVDSRIDPVTLPKFRAELITTVECDSGTIFVNTGTHAQLVPTGDCGAGQYCREGVCLNPPKVPGGGMPTWHLVPTPTTAALNAVTGFGSPPTIIAVGAHGTILRLAPGSITTASAWVQEVSGVTTDLFGVAADNAGDVFAVGAGGVVLVRSASTGQWTRAKTDTIEDLRAVWASGPVVIAVGGSQGHAVVERSLDGGMTWQLDLKAPAAAELRGVFGSSPTNVWIAGRATILHYDGSSYAPGPATTETFNGVFTDGAITYFAASSGALVSTTDGVKLTSIDLAGNSNGLSNVFGFGSDVFVVGANGAIYHGGRNLPFIAEYGDIPAHLAGVWGDAPSDVFAVGSDGAVLHPGLPSGSDGGSGDLAGADLLMSIDMLPAGDLLACGNVTLASVGQAATPDGGAGFSQPHTLAWDGARFLYVLNTGGQLVQLDTVSGAMQLEPIAGFSLVNVSDLAADGAGNLYAVDFTANQVLILTPNVAAGGFTANPLAGNGSMGFTDGANDVATFNQPVAVDVDSNGVLYVADSGNFAIRTVTQVGTVATLAGTGTPGTTNGTGGRNGQATFGTLVDLAWDPLSKNVYVADNGASAIRQIAPNGTTSTLVGLGSVALAADAQGHLYTDASGLVRVTIANGAQEPLIFEGASFSDGSGCGATVAPFQHLAAAASGHQVWMLDMSGNLIQTATFP